MDALNFLKFLRQATMTMTMTSEPHLMVETDTESDEGDSFFELELTQHDFHNKENNNKNDDDPKETQTTTTTEHKSLCSKRKVLPMEPIPKPQSPIALLRSAPSFRIFMFMKGNRTPPQNLRVDDFRSSPAFSRDNSTRSFKSKLQSYSYEGPKPERFSKEVLHKYLKLFKPLYVKVSKRNSDKVRFSGQGFAVSPSSLPSMTFVSSRTDKQGKGMRVVSKHFRNSRSVSAVAGVSSPAMSDDTLQQQQDGIQSAILHCKRSFNSREGEKVIWM